MCAFSINPIQIEVKFSKRAKILSKTLPSADRCSHWTFCNPVCWLPLFCSPFYDNCTNCSMIMAMMGPTEKEVAGGTTVLYDKSNSHFCRQPFLSGSHQNTWHLTPARVNHISCFQGLLIDLPRIIEPIGTDCWLL